MAGGMILSEESKAPAAQRPRLYLMDELRGFAVFCMVFYHAFYTFAFLYEIKWMMILFQFFTPAEPFFAALFIMISGVSSLLSRSNLRRGLRLLAIALAVTLVTAIVTPDYAIWFGILHFLAVCMILYGLLGRYLKKIPFSWVIVLLFVFLYFFTRPIPSGYLGFGPVSVIPLPGEIYHIPGLFPLGFYDSSFRSSDYFPLLPWGFLFLAGTVIGIPVAKGLAPQWMYPSRVPFFSWMGRWALIIYMAHQPLIYALAWLLERLGMIG